MTHGVTASAEFSIDPEDFAHIAGILREGIYSDAKLACLREYGANAFDAHIDAGKSDVPIKVTLPDHKDLFLRIRDFGAGLSEEGIFSIFTKYGRSTKRNSNTTVGQLGIGSKAGFAYAEHFIITSWHGGKKTMYDSVLDASNLGVINKLGEEDCDPAETGIEIEIEVKPSDVGEFRAKAVDLFKYFSPRPKINVPLPPPEESKIRMDAGSIFKTSYNNGSWIGLMGCVPYRIDLNKIRVSHGDALPDYLNHASGVLYFKIGEVGIASNREELKYTDANKKIIIEKFTALVDEFVQRTLTEVKNGSSNPWEKRLKSQVLRSMHLPVPEDALAMMIGSVPFPKDTDLKSFTFQRTKTNVQQIDVNTDSKLLLRDDKRLLSGFNLRGSYLIRKNPGKFTWDQVKEELATLLKTMQCDGIPVEEMSKMAWSPPVKGLSGRTINPKHKTSSFQFDPFSYSYGRTKSKAWSAVSRVATPDDVVVLLDSFEAKLVPGGFWNFKDLYDENCALGQIIKKDHPPVFGYKTTSKVPLLLTAVTGTPYDVWSQKFREEAIKDPLFKAAMEQEGWAGAVSWDYREDSDDSVKTIEKVLGPNHALVLFLKFAAKAHKENQASSHNLVNDLGLIYRNYLHQNPNREAEEAKKLLQKKYPLFGTESFSFSHLWGRDSKKWLQYVKLIDKTP